MNTDITLPSGEDGVSTERQRLSLFCQSVEGMYVLGGSKAVADREDHQQAVGGT